VNPSSSGFLDAVSLGLLAFAIGILPLAAVVATSFMKLTIVFGLLRNAIGVQQVPSNMVTNGIALVLTAYIMAPIGMQAMDTLRVRPPGDTPAQKFADIFESAQEPYRKFLLQHARQRERQFFVRSAASLWPAERAAALKDTDLIVLVPAFTLTELSEAFRIGFLLYMAFVIIDLIIANVLLALGLSQLNPTNLSIPFKLLMFVVIDGWSVLVHGLVLTYR